MTHEPESDPLDEMTQLSRELEPERDLWPGIALQIHAHRAATQRRSERWRLLGLAAVLTLVVGAVAWRIGREAPIAPPQVAADSRREAPGDVSRQLDQRQAPGDVSRHLDRREAPGDVSRQLDRREAPGDVSRHLSTPSLAAYAESDRTLATIRDDLRRSIEAHQERLPPETRALVFENLRTIDRAIAEIEVALQGAPASPDLARTYIAYREREIDLLRQANRLVSRL